MVKCSFLRAGDAETAVPGGTTVRRESLNSDGVSTTQEIILGLVRVGNPPWWGRQDLPHKGGFCFC